MKDNLIYTSFRLNLENPQHVKINKVLQNLNPEVYKSKNNFMATAIEYYIDHYGNDDLTISRQNTIDEYVKRSELGKMREDIEKSAVDMARDEVIRMLGGMFAGMKLQNDKPGMMKSVSEYQNKESESKDYDESDIEQAEMAFEDVVDSCFM